MTKLKALKIKIGIIALIIVSPCFICLIAYVVDVCRGPSSVDSEVHAIVQAQGFVSRSLKSPSSARFPALEWSATGPGSDGSYICSGPVDAENSFGASIRHDCIVLIRHEGNSWRCLDISVVPR